METPPAEGAIRGVAVLNLIHMTAEDLGRITSIESVALILVPASLRGALARIPTRGVASIVPVPDAADVRVHTGTVVLGGEALADPGSDDAVLIVTGTLALSSPVTRVGFREVIVTGMVLAPYGSEGPLGAGLTSVTGSVQYYRYVEGQRFRTFSGQRKLSGASLANAGGDPADVLFLAGQTIITGPVEAVGYQHVVVAGQLVAPREAEALLAPVLTMEGQLAWYDGEPRFLVGREELGRDFLELLDEPASLAIVGSCTIGDDVTPELLRAAVRDIVLIGRIVAPRPLHGVLQLLTTEKHGVISADPDDD